MGNKKEKKFTQKNRKNSKKSGGKWFGLVADDKTQTDSSIVENQPSTVSNKNEVPSQFNAKPPKKTTDGKDYEPAGSYDANNFICGVLDGAMGRKPTKKDPIMVAKATEGVSSSIEEPMEEPSSKLGMGEASLETSIEEPSSKDTYTTAPQKIGGKRSSKKKSDKRKRKDTKNKTKKVKGGKKNKKSKDNH